LGVAGPMGPYYRTVFKQVSLLVERYHCRAFPDGMGVYKAGS